MGIRFWKKFSKAIGRSAPLNAAKTRGEAASAALPQAMPTSAKRAGLTTDPAVIGSLKPSGAGKRRSAQKRRAINPVARHTHAASKEVPVDNWLIEGFKRHQEEERRRETIARPDEAEAAGVGDDHSISDLDSSPSEGGVAVAHQPVRGSRVCEPRRPAGANDEVSAQGLGSLVSRDGGTVLDKRPSRAGRIIMIAGLVVVGGLVSVIGVKTALWGPVDSTNRADAPSVSPPTKKETINRSQGALPKAETSDAPATKPTENGSAPTNDAPTHPSGAAPAGPSDAAIIAAPPAETPEGSKPDPVAPGAEQGSKARSPSQEREQGDRALHEREAAPAAPLPAPVPRATEGASPAKPDKNSNAEPAAVAPERSREQIRPDQEQNASESKRGAVNAGVDAKPKHQAKDRNASRHASRKDRRPLHLSEAHREFGSQVFRTARGEAVTIAVDRRSRPQLMSLPGRDGLRNRSASSRRMQTPRQTRERLNGARTARRSPMNNLRGRRSSRAALKEAAMPAVRALEVDQPCDEAHLKSTWPTARSVSAFKREHSRENDHRAVSHQDDGGAAHHHAQRARGPSCQRVQQCLPFGRRPRHHRPADRQRHGRHVRPSMGGSHARRRKLRRQSLLATLRANRARDYRFQTHFPDASGTRRRAHSGCDAFAKGERRSQQRSLRYDAREHRICRRRCDGFAVDRSARSAF